MTRRSLFSAAAAASALLFTNVALGEPLETPASEASIRELIEVTQARKILDGLNDQLDGASQASMQQALAGQQVSPEQQQVLNEMRTKMIRIITDSMQWDQMEPMFIDIYKQIFTQAEIDGMLAFYKTETGQALIAKMPLVMQYSMQVVQARAASIMPQVQQLQRETLEKLKALQAPPAKRTD